MAKNPTSRVIRTSDKAKASVFLQENEATLVGDERNFVVADDRGITIKGSVSFVSDALSRRQAGLFTGINDFLELIPQTIVTPVPSKVIMPNTFAVINIAKDLAFFMSLLV